MKAMWPFSWCSWSEWSVCTIEPCLPGPRSFRRKFPSPPPHPPRDIALKEFCINSTEFPIKVRRWPETEDNFSPEIIVPMQMRRRQCRCRGISNIIGRLFSRNCEESDEVVECHSCFEAPISVYTHVVDGESLLSCTELANIRSAEAAAAANANSSRFYSILGGTLGTAAFLILIFCCIRFFLLSSAARRRAARRSTGDIENASDNFSHGPVLRRSGVGVPYPHLRNSELPPPYKDVVAMAVIFPADSDSSRTLHGDEDATNQRLLLPMPALQSSEPFKADGNVDEGVEEPPPPSYQEVIAFSPSAADMHLRIMAASSVVSEAEENQNQSASSRS